MNKLIFTLAFLFPTAILTTEVPCHSPEESVDLTAGSTYTLSGSDFKANDTCPHTFNVPCHIKATIQCTDTDLDFNSIFIFVDYDYEYFQEITGSDSTEYTVGARDAAFYLFVDFYAWIDYAEGKYTCTVTGSSESPTGTGTGTETGTGTTGTGTETGTGTTGTGTGTTTPTGDCECGRRGRSVQRIVGGEDASPGELPWQVGLLYYGSSTPSCGATLINNKWLLSAAHCTDGQDVSNIEAIIGEFDVSTTQDNAVKIKIAKKVEHPNYNSNSMVYDFVMLELAEEVTFSAAVGPACLPQDASKTYVDAIATASGWGTLQSGGSQPDKLQRIDTLKVLANDNCGSYSAGTIQDSMVCAADAGKDSCQGDSGGPLVTQEGDRYSLIGVVSFGRGCALADYPGVYSRVTTVLDWIKSTASGSTFCGN